MKPYQKQSPTKEEALGKPGALFINFAGAALAYRLRAGAREPLLAALGRRQLNDPPLVDATAGLGRDAFIAAAAGFEVTMIERVPEAHHALAAALERARAGDDDRTAAAAARMSLIFGDARTLLPRLAPQVALVDPMHPERRKTALVKLAMRRLKEIAGPGEDASELINVALRATRRRVVLKWPAKAPLPAGVPAPTYELPGRTIRFVVYARD